PNRSEKINKKENIGLNLATSALVFAKKYEEEAIQYDNKFSYGNFKVTIEENPSKKNLQCIRYLQYNLHGIYIHFDLECAKKNSLKVYLLDKSPNALIYEKIPVLVEVI
ncbi:1223_t:CDS:2, partial [Gigaspora margarita]